MRFHLSINTAALLWLSGSGVDGYLPSAKHISSKAWTRRSAVAPLQVSIGLGPDENKTDEEKELVAGEDYEIPDHEEYRLSRRSKMDVKCDEWYGSLLGTETGVLDSIAEGMLEILKTPVPLINEVSQGFCLIVF